MIAIIAALVLITVGFLNGSFATGSESEARPPTRRSLVLGALLDIALSVGWAWIFLSLSAERAADWFSAPACVFCGVGALFLAYRKLRAARLAA